MAVVQREGLFPDVSTAPRHSCEPSQQSTGSCVGLLRAMKLQKWWFRKQMWQNKVIVQEHQSCITAVDRVVKVDGNGGISITRREFSYRFQLEFRRFFNVLVSTRLCEEKRELTAISMVPTSLSALSKSTVALFQVRNEVSALNEVTKASLCVLTVLVQHYLSHRAGK